MEVGNIKVVIAPDSFKGSVTAMEAACAIEKGVKAALPSAETVIVPMADGGEGTVETLVSATSGHQVSKVVTGPLGRKVEATYGVLGDSVTCVVEVASASGIHLLTKDELNPMQTTTFGTGELIKHALDDGYRKFILALGGSATNDGGAGMLQALGISLKDKEGNEVGFGGGKLRDIRSIDMTHFDKRVEESTFLIASDVENPLIGKSGASYVFGPQKGATPDMVVELDMNLQHFANLIEETTEIHIHDVAGAGAAGGIGGAFQAFFPAVSKRGVEVVLEYSGFNEILEGADLVITGEGQVDSQTAFGKTPMGVAEAARKNNIPTIILAGSVGDNIQNLYPYGVIGVYSIINRPMTLETAIKEASKLLEQKTEQICRTFFARG